MAKRGRPRKAGAREKNGRPQREPIWDRGSDWVQKQRERYGEHYNSALGRAFAGGLLGRDDEGKARYDAGKRFLRAYGAVFGFKGYACPLDDTPRGGTDAPDNPDRIESEAKRQRWLYAAIDSMDVDGSRGWLNQLLAVEYTDAGPPWLSRLLDRGGDATDRMALAYAIRALDIITPETAKRLTTSATYETTDGIK